MNGFQDGTKGKGEEMARRRDKGGGEMKLSLHLRTHERK
jgi:hypothetical protein